ncbi:single stranded DNA-binding domain-containing protein [Arthrobacter dokdonensis]|uniref:OB-fold nucleic acid binding domain-containing protein n=1 Tax=Arthrobacter dokdonellae TaxID=2211210 RepID=UPI000DE59E47|nr:OB-fold nucleic acid binding domain-containing protein [Arthrobacter dokdonellae]
MPTNQGDRPLPVPINELPLRGRAVSSGVIDAVTILPLSSSPEFSAIVTDREFHRMPGDGGSHRLRLVWLGRRRVPGIDVGTRLRVEGMVSLRGGLPTMFNPRYEIIGTQEG